MSFKKTSEGRVFFQGVDNGANDEVAPSPISQGSRSDFTSGLKPTIKSDQQTQIQIIGLLKALNERLKSTQAERDSMRKELDAYRNVIEGLENKAERNERAYLDIENKLTSVQEQSEDDAQDLSGEALRQMEETRKLLVSLEGKTEQVDRDMNALKNNVERHQQVGSQMVQKQAALEKQQQQQARKVSEHSQIASKIVQRIKDGEERYEGLNDKLEQTSGDQAKIARKLDKALEERARFMRKIERIEETVIQTRDSLNAKAMVLLTDQQAAAQNGEEVFSPQPYSQAQPQPQVKTQAFRNTEEAPQVVASPAANLFSARDSDARGITNIQKAMIGAFLVLGVSGGLIIALIQNPTLFSATLPTSTPIEKTQAVTPRYVAPQSETSALESATLNEATDIEALEWQIEQQIADAQPQTEAQAHTQEAEMPTQDYSDDIGALDLQDSEQVRAALEGRTEKLAAALNAIEPTDAIEDAAPQAPKATVAEPAKPAPVINTNAFPDPASLISPDTSLPALIKDIEAQAFNNVAEAQHDLAAIYTAGHGGVSQNFERARFWFERSAERGVANAAYNLGVIYHQGLGTEADMDAALNWYSKAADLGHPEAQYNLGIAYIEGIGVPYNPVKASAYFENAAANDIMEAAYNLGLIYENGLLGDAQPDMAIMWYKIAADNGSPEAKEALEQLAKALGIDAAEVNRLADGMKALKKPETVKAISDRVSNTTPNPAVNGQIITAQIQGYLMSLGLYPGPADGINGPLTADAVRSYQRENNLGVNGAITQELLDYMLASAE